MRLTISRGMLDEMIERAASSPEAEICGLLLGQGRAVEAVVACTNVSEEPSDSFEIDPAALIVAHRTARTGGSALLGHYHSHPFGPAAPSERDRAAAEPGLFWIILGQGQARGWYALRAKDGALRFDPVELVAID